jgi:hypothetical protein
VIKRLVSLVALCASSAMFLAGCQAAPDNQPLLSKKSPVELRAMQERVFQTGDRDATLRAVIATFQDLGYSLDKVEANTGTVSATKLAMLKMSASVYNHGSSQTVVRANALVLVDPQWHQVDLPEFYQKGLLRSTIQGDVFAARTCAR